MSKKTLDRKAAQQFIIASRDNNKTDQEIYNELVQQYYDKKDIALLITGTVTTGNKQKYKLYNNILLGLLGLAIVSRILLVVNLTMQSGQAWALLLVFIVPALAAYFAYEIARYNAPLYRVCGIMTLVGFAQSMSKSDGGPELMVNLILASTIAGLCFYLDNKMFPHYTPQKLKKDSNGEYILNP